MGEQFTEITNRHRAFIEAQQMYFVGTAARNGRVNVSPKGLDSLRVLSPTRVAWLNGTGSGNETAAHLAENGRVTFMFCAFAGAPRILRLYGRGAVVLPDSDAWASLAAALLHAPRRRPTVDGRGVALALVAVALGLLAAVAIAGAHPGAVAAARSSRAVLAVAAVCGLLSVALFAAYTPLVSARRS